MLANYRADISKHLEKVLQALNRIEETSEQLLQEVVVEGELTVPGAALKLANRLKSLATELEIPEEITYSSVQVLVEGLENLLRSCTEAGRRYVPRLPPVHKKVIKDLDYQIRQISQGYTKLKKLWEKNKLPMELDKIQKDVEELLERIKQIVKIVHALKEMRQQEKTTVGKIEEQQEDIEQFRMDSGLVEADEIRRETDAIRMLVTNQLNFLKKPFKKLSQAAGQTMMIGSTAIEGADAYSTDPWQAFQKDTEGLDKLKASLSALAEAAQLKKIKFKQSLERKIVDRRHEVCEKGSLDKYRKRFSALLERQQEISSQVSVEERRDLEKTLERAKWEHRDISAEITHQEEQQTRVSERLSGLKIKLERALKRVLNDDFEIILPDEVLEILTET
jgi:hypothetical protein